MYIYICVYIPYVPILYKRNKNKNKNYQKAAEYAQNVEECVFSYVLYKLNSFREN